MKSNGWACLGLLFVLFFQESLSCTSPCSWIGIGVRCKTLRQWQLSLEFRPAVQHVISSGLPESRLMDIFGSNRNRIEAAIKEAFTQGSCVVLAGQNRSQVGRCMTDWLLEDIWQDWVRPFMNDMRAIKPVCSLPFSTIQSLRCVWTPGYMSSLISDTQEMHGVFREVCEVLGTYGPLRGLHYDPVRLAEDFDRRWAMWSTNFNDRAYD